jgi:hypothetical protein
MNKKIYEKKSILHCVSQFMVFKKFQNCFPLYQWHHTIFLCQKKYSTKHFNKYDESIIISYGLRCKVFGTSKVQYVMIIQNLFMKFIYCDHITCNIIFMSPFHILIIYICYMAMAHD